MRSYEIDEDIRTTLFSIHNVRIGQQNLDESFLLGRMYAIIDYASDYLEDIFGCGCEYDRETNTVKDDRGRDIYDYNGRTYVEADDEEQEVDDDQ